MEISPFQVEAMARRPLIGDHRPMRPAISLLIAASFVVLPACGDEDAPSAATSDATEADSQAEPDTEPGPDTESPPDVDASDGDGDPGDPSPDADADATPDLEGPETLPDSAGDVAPDIDVAPELPDSEPDADALIELEVVDVGPEISEPTDPLEGAGAPELLHSGLGLGEGALWLEASQTLLFTDIPNSVIWEYDPNAPASEDTPLTVFRQPSDHANGLGLDPQGRLIACEHATRRVTRTEADGQIVPLADLYQEMKLNSPNDNISRSDGTLYFSDPSYGIPAGQSSELGYRGLFRLDTSGTLHLEDSDFSQPNGVALSPDESVLYVSDSQAGFVRRYDVAADGSLSGAAPFVADTGGGGDGMAMDDEGNLYVTKVGGILVVRPDGTPWGEFALPANPTNCSFGGADRKTLYITTFPALYRVELGVPGLP